VAKKTTKNSVAEEKSLPYFRAEGLKFLSGLARNNRREWFQARRETYERELKAPMLEIVRRVNDAIAEFSPEHLRAPEKCMMRIYRDTRFSQDKTPYKRHVAAWWACEGMEKTSGGGFYFHVSAKEVVIAAGIFMPQREQLLAIRSWLLDNHEEFRGLLANKKLRKVFDEFEGISLSRPPKGFSKDHPAIDLLRCQQWGVSATLPVESALKPKFASVLAESFRLAAPLVRALNTPLKAKTTARRKVLFGLY
jgi:uncharacterized protein (TIGR02453 family)